MKTLNYPQSLISEHRLHCITLSQSVLLADYFNNAEVEKSDNEQWTPNDFSGKDISTVGYYMGGVRSHSEMFIHSIICILFNYEQVG